MPPDADCCSPGAWKAACAQRYVLIICLGGVFLRVLCLLSRLPMRRCPRITKSDGSNALRSQSWPFWSFSGKAFDVP